MISSLDLNNSIAINALSGFFELAFIAIPPFVYGWTVLDIPSDKSINWVFHSGWTLFISVTLFATDPKFQTITAVFPASKSSSLVALLDIESAAQYPLSANSFILVAYSKYSSVSTKANTSPELSFTSNPKVGVGAPDIVLNPYLSSMYGHWRFCPPPFAITFIPLELSPVATASINFSNWS